MAGKLKTRRSAAKRFKVTATGKLKHSKTCRNHLLLNKWRATKKDKFGKIVAAVDAVKIAALIPYKMR
jgi:large subunit ribosomal protein L35